MPRKNDCLGGKTLPAYLRLSLAICYGLIAAVSWDIWIVVSACLDVFSEVLCNTQQDDEDHA